MKHYYASVDDASLKVDLHRDAVVFVAHSLVLDDEIPEQARQQQTLDKALERNPVLGTMLRKLDMEAAEAMARESVEQQKQAAIAGAITAQDMLAQQRAQSPVIPTSIREAAPDATVGSEASPHSMHLQMPGAGVS